MADSLLLLVEDEPGLIMTLTDRLLAEGYEVESATDAPTGLETASAGAFESLTAEFSFAIVDCEMFLSCVVRHNQVNVVLSITSIYDGTVCTLRAFPVWE